MKLASVTLRAPTQVGRHHVAMLTLEVFPEGITLDVGQRLIRVGRDIIPLEAALVMREAEPGEQCPDCAEKFSSLQAVGAHRRHKHGVKGNET